MKSLKEMNNRELFCILTGDGDVAEFDGVFFRGEVDDGTRAVRGQQLVDQRAVTDVTLHEDMTGVTDERRQRLAVAGIGQLVEIDDGLVVLREPVEYEIGADEAGAAGDEDHVGGSWSVDEARSRAARDYPWGMTDT